MKKLFNDYKPYIKHVVTLEWLDWRLVAYILIISALLKILLRM